MGSFNQMIRETRAALHLRFPSVISAKGGTKRPLKIGIAKDIAALVPEISRKQIGLFLRDYTNGNHYLQAMVAGADRIDLDGKPSGVVTGEHAAEAAFHLQRNQSRQRNNWLRKRAAARAETPVEKHLRDVNRSTALVCLAVTIIAGLAVLASGPAFAAPLFDEREPTNTMFLYAIALALGIMGVIGFLLRDREG